MRVLSWVLAVLVICCASPVLCAPASTHLSGPVSQSHVQAQIKDILSAPEYNRVYNTDAKSNFAQKFLDKLGKWIRDFFLWMRNALSLKTGSAGRVASFVFACLVLVGFVALVVLIVRKLAKSAKGWNGEALPYDLHDAYELPSAQPLIREAAKLAEAGDYRGAFRCAYMASISHLDDARALRFERGRTNWEYMRELKRGGFDESWEALRPVTLTFDCKFYGREKCGREDYLSALEAYKLITGEAAA